ncbi:hypothetical protein N657DRAFT_642404 [Parathielavia appendiculata]|uniref:Uncharacterized protein n=1 Tax=Parathielavia appendiculata TaxID=2587402 RepID=A0AAN6U4G4_9PEZI|nr:hypothetical protein N657DRAFT_642404 [Parathielavia appendiculata]
MHRPQKPSHMPTTPQSPFQSPFVPTTLWENATRRSLMRAMLSTGAHIVRSYKHPSKPSSSDHSTLLHLPFTLLADVPDERDVML